MSGALALRAWALDVLATDGAHRLPAPPAMLRGDALATAWDLFLRTERCALPLRSRLLAAAGPSLPPGPADVLEARASVEVQHALSAQAQLLEIQRLAGAHNIEPIVLKGGVLALGDHTPLDVADADALVRNRAEAEMLARLLDEQGYRAFSQATVWHLAPRFTEGDVQVEVHFDIQDVDDVPGLRARAQPLPGYPGLRRFAPPDHLWHLLVHCAVSHLARRGCVRDAILIQRALQDCSAAEVDDVSRRAALHPRRAPLTAMLALATALGSGGPVDDYFAREAAANYLLRSRFRWLARLPALGESVSLTVFALLGNQADRSAEWGGVFGRPVGRARWELAHAVERRWPELGNGTRRVLRIVRLALARPLAWPIAASARQIAARFSRGAARR